ncbi:MAG: lycopene cyclase [Saprospiraceae bacterium]|nr:lycopene cyclase [Saprospiraceae bacterium]
MQTESYDIIFAGAGLSGLTLALELLRRPAFQQHSMLLIDRDEKRHNDRTWCFWAEENEPLPPVIFNTWARCDFFGTNFQQRMDIAPFRYHQVRGIDFYQWAKAELARHPKVRFLTAAIHRMDAESGRVETDAGAFSANWVFNSAFTRTQVLPAATGLYPNPPFSPEPATAAPPAAILLLQHFKGWLIETPQPAFDPAAMTFMDFRIEQTGETRFVYVLPFSETRALVEFTVFSPALLAAEAYGAALRDYLRQYLGVTDFSIVEEEFGVIPMTDFPFPARREGRLIHIGTAGGFVKASSGYAFKRTQRKIRALVDAWEKNGVPDPAYLRSPWLFRAFDSIFLRVLANQNALGRRIFSDLFRQLPPALVLRFLDEDSTFVENLRLVSAPPTWPFLRALWQQLPKWRQI